MARPSWFSLFLFLGDLISIRAGGSGAKLDCSPYQFEHRGPGWHASNGFGSASGPLEVVPDWAASNARLDDEDRYGITLTALAAYAGQLEVVQDLAARDTQLDDEDKAGMTPMDLAANAGQLAV